MDHLTSKQAAEYLGIGLLSFRYYVSVGKLVPDVRLNPRCFLWTRETLDRSGVSSRDRAGDLTPEQITEANRRRDAGEKVADIAKSLGVQPGTIYRATGARHRMRPRLSAVQRNQIRALSKQGLTQAEIARKLEVTTGQVWRVVNENGVKKAKKPPP